MAELRSHHSDGAGVGGVGGGGGLLQWKLRVTTDDASRQQLSRISGHRQQPFAVGWLVPKYQHNDEKDDA
ncbi:hypothetical protein M0804_004863 [Polistes exclamans]|nr:hypothetical protein M0804_004863 [Polistes exclamans]